MIKSWNKFFEANEGEFTEEMAQEILYTFGENSHGYDRSDYEIRDFLLSEDVWDDIVFYEAGYDDMKEFTQTLLNNAKKNPDIKSKCIEVYNYIRKKNENFPEIYQIEDHYLHLIEKYGLDFYVNINMGIEYEIELKVWNNWEDTGGFDKFFKMCQDVERSIKKLESNKYHTELIKCEFSKYSISFKIELRSRV